MYKLTSILCAFILTTWIGNLQAQQYQLASPDGANQINVYLDDQISYTVIHNGKLLLDKSPVSITVNGQKLGDNPRVKRTKTRQVNEVITPVVKEKFAQFPDQYNMLSLDFRGNYGLDFKAYNDGIAYRFRTAYKKDITVDAEEINYRFTADHKTTFPIADGFFTHYERGYTTQPMSKLGKAEMSCLPVMVHLDDGVKVVISEADLYDYPGYYLKNTAVKNGLNAVFPLYPKKYEQPNDRDVKVAEREAYLGITSGTRTFPWRFMVITDTDKELIENTMVLSCPRR
ncbi:glycoside hydrolase family 97 N-terminal domain-containing protein [Fulvivirgaceae bacterium BMA12]|uniref:Glycoside hydrolase family 97 N-terminal domain-containing protein n=1 Tax=Agaribacillus aureus TaxID=3051825 RepID=A0ABT8L130_9BACT|nr:glycoside hydrolase family 97 N-terminal domain-containing protein [Fulvivirgaceae bacterium BMA12]